MAYRVIGALVAFALLSIMAALTLDGKIRAAVLILMAGLALKTVLTWKARS